MRPHDGVARRNEGALLASHSLPHDRRHHLWLVEVRVQQQLLHDVHQVVHLHTHRVTRTHTAHRPSQPRPEHTLCCKALPDTNILAATSSLVPTTGDNDVEKSMPPVMLSMR